MDDVGLGTVPVDANSVDQEMIGSRHELLDGPAHGEKRRPIDVELVDPGYVDGGNGVSDGVAFDALGQLFASRLIEQFGIAQALDAVVGLEDHGGGNDGAEQRASANFVHAGNES